MTIGRYLLRPRIAVFRLGLAGTFRSGVRPALVFDERLAGEAVISVNRFRERREICRFHSRDHLLVRQFPESVRNCSAPDALRRPNAARSVSPCHTAAVFGRSKSIRQSAENNSRQTKLGMVASNVLPPSTMKPPRSNPCNPIPDRRPRPTKRASSGTFFFPCGISKIACATAKPSAVPTPKPMCSGGPSAEIRTPVRQVRLPFLPHI